MIIVITTSDTIAPRFEFDSFSEAVKFAAYVAARDYCKVWWDGELIHSPDHCNYNKWDTRYGF